jgi:hypothetical protein
MQPARKALFLASALAVGSLAFASPATAQDESLPPLPELPPVGPSITTTVSPQMPDYNGLPSAPLPESELETLPAEYRSLPVGGQIETTTTDADGVEVITRTRRIAGRSPAQAKQIQDSYAPPAYAPQGYGYAPQPYAAPGYGYAPTAYAPVYPAPAPAVFDRESWLDECRRRIDGRSEREKGGIIGGLLGAIGGGIIGNVVADGERLGGTLIGAGVGGLAGLLLGNLIGGGKKNDRYDCEAALDGYLTQYGPGQPRMAMRTIPAPAPPPAAYGYGYAQPAYGYAQQQMVYVPVQYQQQQRVIVRETVREELVDVPSAARSIPRDPVPVPLPAPRMIKQAPVAAPRSIKGGY